MLRSYEIARVRGISILLHPSFIIFIAFLILAFYLSGGGFYAVAGALYLIFLFSFVVFHELAHSMTAKSYGINVRKITLLPIGGVAELERYPKDPKAELRIAAAGPLSNFLLASLFFLLLHILNLSISYSSLGGIPELLDIRALLIMGIQVNLALGLFNLIPAFPMDGGRILRALLARRMSLVEATERASRIARIIAILMFVFGLFYNPVLLFIALFVYLSGLQEMRSVRLMEFLEGVKVSDVMHEAYEVHPDTPLINLYGIPADFVVFEDGNPVGVVTWIDVLNGLREGKKTCREVMREVSATVSPEDDLGEVLPSIRPVAVVYENGVLYGVVDENDVMRVLQQISWRRFLESLFGFGRR